MKEKENFHGPRRYYTLCQIIISISVYLQYIKYNEGAKGTKIPTA